jgi:putative tricarboxylic transport membrane protein
MVITNLLQGLSAALSFENIVACFMGSFMGTVTGVLPGLGPAAAMALLLPITFNLPPTTGLIMLAGIYYGAMYGGSTTSILLNMPGETASLVTCFDGYQMARNGRAGAALAVSAIGSWIAGTVSIVGLMLFAPVLARIALGLGPAEYFLFVVLGLLVLTNLTGSSPVKAALMLILGLMISTIGTEIIRGSPRYTFGFIALIDGIDPISLLMGLFGMSEVFTVLLEKGSVSDVIKVRFRDLYPTIGEIKKSILPMIRGTAIGFIMGLLPGPAHILSTFVSYKVEQSASPQPELFGKGAIEGVAGPEAANNAASTSAMIPLFALGLPFTVQAAILISCLKVHRISPSPLLISQHGDIFWAVVASMYIGNVVLLLLNLPLVGVFASLMRTPKNILVPVITGIMIVGAYAIVGSTFNVWLLLGAGLVGYLMKQVDYPAVPLVIGLVLGPMFEQCMGQALMLAQGDLSVICCRPGSAVILVIIALVILWAVAGKTIKRLLKNERNEAGA